MKTDKPYRIVMTFAILFITVFASVISAFGAEEKPYFAAENIFARNADEHPQNHASSIAELPNGDLLVSWFGGSREGMPDVAVWVSRRPAGSREWARPEKLVDDPDYAAGNSIVFADSSGKVWLFYLIKYAERWDAWEECKVFAVTSDDNGKTWSEPRVIQDGKGWVIRNNPVEIEPGRILLPVYTEDPPDSWMWISDDGFKTKEVVEVPAVAPGHYQPAVAPLGGDKMIMLARHYTVPGKIWVSISKDKGRSWFKPKLTGLPNPDSGISLIMLESGALLLAYNNSKWVRTPLTVAISDNGGRSWPWKKNLETASAEFSYPYLIQDRNGIIHITYTSDSRKYIKHAEFNEAWLRSK